MQYFMMNSKQFKIGSNTMSLLAKCLSFSATNSGQNNLMNPVIIPLTSYYSKSS